MDAEARTVSVAPGTWLDEHFAPVKP